MRFPCSVNELLRMRSYIDIHVYKETYIYISFLRAYRRTLLCFISVITFKLLRKQLIKLCAKSRPSTLKLQACRFANLINLGRGGFGISFSKRSTIFSRIVDVKDRLRHSKLNVAMKLYIVTWRKKKKEEEEGGKKLTLSTTKYVVKSASVAYNFMTSFFTAKIALRREGRGERERI